MYTFMRVVDTKFVLVQARFKLYYEVIWIYDYSFDVLITNLVFFNIVNVNLIEITVTLIFMIAIMIILIKINFLYFLSIF